MIYLAIVAGQWTIADAAGVAAATGTLGSLLWMMSRQAHKDAIIRDEDLVRQARIDDEILGRPESQGVPAIPSVSARITDVYIKLQRVEEVTKTLQKNGGNSAMDKIISIEKKVDEIKAKQDEAKERLDALEAKNAQQTNRPNNQRNRRSPRAKPSTEGEK